MHWKVRDLTDEEIIEKLGDDKCKYCPYESIDFKDGSSVDCPKRVVNYGSGAEFPICYDDPENVNKLIVERYKEETGE